MSAQISSDQIADLVLMTLNDLGRMRWTEIATDLQEHIALPNILRQERVRFESGQGVQRNVQIDHSGAAKHIGMFGKDTISVGDVMRTMRIPWRHTTTNWAFDRREITMNRNPARIVDLMKIRRADAMIALAQLMEETFWGKPDTDDDELTPFGIDYWMVRDATSTGDFDGGNPAGFPSGAGGINSTTTARWSNYTFGWTEVSKRDLVSKMRKCYEFIQFKSPVDIPAYDRGAPRFVLYMNYDTLAELELLAESQNDRMGFDIAPADGRTAFRGAPMRWVPQLNADTANPIYFVNWSVLMPVFLSGEYLREDGPMRSSGKHTVQEVHVDTTWNMLCVNRRKLGIGSQ